MFRYTIPHCCYKMHNTSDIKCNLCPEFRKTSPDNCNLFDIQIWPVVFMFRRLARCTQIKYSLPNAIPIIPNIIFKYNLDSPLLHSISIEVHLSDLDSVLDSPSTALFRLTNKYQTSAQGTQEIIHAKNASNIFQNPTTALNNHRRTQLISASRHHQSYSLAICDREALSKV